MENKKPTVAVAIICKNEMELIGRCLDSVKDADAIYVCDTGSTDGGETVRVAQQYTKNVCTDYKWNDSFCEARNHVKSHVKEDWILSIDADEFLHDFSKVREAIELAEKEGILTVDITQISESDGQVNFFPRLFKNSPAVYWHGAAHNYLSVVGKKVGDVRLTYGYSLAHLQDPDRTLRILEKEVKEGRGGAREMYYLSREYFYRNQFRSAAAMLGKYVQISRFPAEKADAFLMMARCYLAEGLPDDARDACLQAIGINPEFKEALLFMCDLSWPKQAATWRKFSELTTNEGVLFKRT